MFDRRKFADFQQQDAFAEGPPPRTTHISSTRVRRGLFLAAIVVLVLMSSVQSPATETLELHLASDAWPPFTNTADHSRLAIDLVHQALDRVGITATTRIVDFGAVILGLQDGSFDGSGALWRTTERESLLLFSEPYLENRLILVGRKGSDVSATDLSDLKGKRIAIVGSYGYGEAVKNASEPIFVNGQNDQENLQKLLAGEVDFMLVDELLIQYVLAHQKSEVAEFLGVGATTLIRRTLHFAVRKTLIDAASIIERFNAEIKTMLADGTYNKVLHLNWIRADVDGDGHMELVPINGWAGGLQPITGYDVLTRDSAGGASDETDRYWIDGQTYEGWDKVPENYKRQENAWDGPAAPKPNPFKFTF